MTHTASLAFTAVDEGPAPGFAGASVSLASANPSSHWTVQTRSGLQLQVPPSLRSLTTYVLLEQESWFEPEMSLLPHLLQGGVHALDIGANHGVVTLAMAQASGTGRVWAFEPTQAPRAALCASVRLNGLSARVQVLPLALAERAGQTQFEVQDNSELNARAGNAARSSASAPARNAPAVRLETVQLETLDNVLQTQGINQRIGFVKLDAEGDELRVLAGARRFFAEQSPIVMFEFKHGQQVNTALLDAWNGLGYGIFRWSHELQLLLPFDPIRAETAFALNLVALRGPEQEEWAARGLLVTAAALAQAQQEAEQQAEASAAGLEGNTDSWRKPGFGDTGGCPAAWVEAAHSRSDLSAAKRLCLMLQARDRLMSASDPGLCDWVLLVHCLHALGQPLAAVQMGAQLLQHWPPDAVLPQPFSPSLNATPLMPPLRSQIARAQHGSTGDWLRHMLAEYVALHSNWSSYFEPAAPQRWAALMMHPDHGAEVERRCLLAHVLGDRMMPPALLARLHHLGCGEPAYNATLWRGIIDAMRVMAQAAAQPADVLADMLAQWPELTVQVVDVGASPLGTPDKPSPEPYATLVKAQCAHVTAFEPDPAALRALRQQHPNAGSHQFLPHFVGNGQPALFHETEWPLTASLFEPQREQLDRYQQLGALVQERARHPVQTVRLDDVIASAGMDFLKIDVQGAEGLVFEGACARLADCLMVWTEVEFVPLYRGQPLFAEIDQQLRQQGLQFLCFAGLASRSLASWSAPSPTSAPSELSTPRQASVKPLRAPLRPQQLWADAIYVPSPDRIAALDATAAAKLAMLAHHVAGAYDLCHAALLRLDAVNESSFAPRYMAACR